MKRLNQILNNPEYIAALEKIAECEQDRIFCKHDIEHFLSVARIMYIYSLEKNLKLEKDIIYATAILHDIGRHLEYLKGIPHALASASLAKGILAESAFLEDEQGGILFAISRHNSSGDQDPLSSLLQWADHESRNCFHCNAQAECKWTQEEKNRGLVL